MSITSNLNNFLEELKGSNCQLIAVSKTKPVTDIMELYHAGFKRFGENRVPELVEKYQSLPKDIEWHMIGHLQTNKVKYIAPFVHLIHGVDSLKLAREIDKQAAKNDRIIPCLLQVHIAQEQNKFGFDGHELYDLIRNGSFDEFPNLKISGLMGMATYTDDHEQIRREFRKLKALFDEINLQLLASNFNFTEISMGMSSDYQLAIEEGSTMIRVGSRIFGARN
jgi:pyridoxal phosphate enzyme (YggS family)